MATENKNSPEVVLRLNLRELMKTRAGKAVIWDLLAECGLYNSSFGLDDRNTNFLLGKQSVGLYIVDKLTEADPKAFPKLLLDNSGETKDE